MNDWTSQVIIVNEMINEKSRFNFIFIDHRL